MNSSDLAKSVECPVCLDVFEQPKSLPCGHCVCEACVGGVTLSGGLRIVCPVCRVESAVPAGGFPTNYTVVGFVEQIHRRSGKVKFKCVTCAASLLRKELYVCGGCDRRVFCSHCAIAQHNGHQLTKLTAAVGQYNKQKAEWHRQAKEDINKCSNEMELGEHLLHHQLNFMIDRCQQLKEGFGRRFGSLEHWRDEMLVMVDQVGATAATQNSSGALSPLETPTGKQARLAQYGNLVDQYLEDRDKTLHAVDLDQFWATTQGLLQ